MGELTACEVTSGLLNPQTEEHMKTKATKKPIRLDTTDKLLRLAGKYLEEKGGRALVAGPVCVIQMPGSTDTNFYLAVKVLGRKPIKGKLD